MKSMTAYAYKEMQNESFHLMLELKSYNNRYLDIVFNMPSLFNPLEQPIREAIKQFAQRGRVEATVRFRELEENVKIHLDKQVVRAYRAVLSELAEELGISKEFNLEHFLNAEGVLKTEKNRDSDRYWEYIEPLLAELLHEFRDQRIREGQETKKDILLQLDDIRNLLSVSKSYSLELEKSLVSSIRERFYEVLGNEIDEKRILAETAVLLVRYNINEEISRLQGHIHAFVDLCQQDRANGKKLDFLCQEMNREINTIGSKSTIMEINHAVVTAKDALEKIREQLRNVE